MTEAERVKAWRDHRHAAAPRARARDHHQKTPPKPPEARLARVRLAWDDPLRRAVVTGSKPRRTSALVAHYKSSRRHPVVPTFVEAATPKAPRAAPKLVC